MPELAALIGFATLYIVGAIPSAIAVTACALLTAAVAAGIIAAAQSARSGIVLTLDPDGVAVCDLDPVRWSELREIVVGPVQPAWLLGGRSMRVLAFIPQPGIALPDPPGRNGGDPARARSARLRQYGTNWVVLGAMMNPPLKEVVAAAAALGGLPVRELKSQRWRLWLVLLPVAVLVGAIAALSA